MSTDAAILILEDEFMIAMEFETVLMDAGYRIIGPAADVDTALKLIEAEAPTACVLDVNLGLGETSAPVAGRLTEIGIPFVLCTGYQTADLLQRYGDTVPVLQKPVDTQRLLEEMKCLTSRPR